MRWPLLDKSCDSHGACFARNLHQSLACPWCYGRRCRIRDQTCTRAPPRNWTGTSWLLVGLCSRLSAVARSIRGQVKLEWRKSIFLPELGSYASWDRGSPCRWIASGGILCSSCPRCYYPETSHSQLLVSEEIVPLVVCFSSRSGFSFALFPINLINY